MPKLLQRDRTVMGRTISNVFSEHESDVDVVCVNFAHTTQHIAIKENKMLYFNKWQNYANS